MWGQVYRRKIISAIIWFIPTHVGTRSFYPQMFRRRWDHPHACGDKDVLYALNAKEIEPAATKRRGLGAETDSASTGSKISIADFLDDVKSYYSDVLSDSVRIIPTRVGTSIRFLRLTVNQWDHPHACGDKHMSYLPTSSDWGSSPRVWGQVCIKEISVALFRIIPTRVGTSSVWAAKS